MLNIYYDCKCKYKLGKCVNRVYKLMVLKIFKKLVNYLSLLPGIGEKSAIKIAEFMLESKYFSLDEFIDILETFKNEVHKCPECGFLAYKTEKCEICMDKNRDRKKILIVENIADVLIVESTKVYNGLYHILDGLISPEAGITPADLFIESLLKRINNDLVEEIILGLPKTSYGEITSYFIADIIKKNKNSIKITTLIEGVSSHLEINKIIPSALMSAIKNRKPL